jgi:predicted 2-oxoglutarate/Fe(II)-dependent dioxygenase YbiX
VLDEAQVARLREALEAAAADVGRTSFAVPAPVREVA